MTIYYKAAAMLAGSRLAHCCTGFLRMQQYTSSAAAWQADPNGQVMRTSQFWRFLLVRPPVSEMQRARGRLRSSEGSALDFSMDSTGTHGKHAGEEK